jgi:hypothetical protein
MTSQAKEGSPTGIPLIEQADGAGVVVDLEVVVVEVTTGRVVVLAGLEVVVLRFVVVDRVVVVEGLVVVVDRVVVVDVRVEVVVVLRVVDRVVVVELEVLACLRRTVSNRAAERSRILTSQIAPVHLVFFSGLGWWDTRSQ